MGFGVCGNGGGPSSSSNLSALAPPFTFERLITKPISAPLVDLTEPPYGVASNSSSLQNWFPSHTPTTSTGINFAPNSSSVPSPDAYKDKHPGSKNIKSPNMHLPSFNPVTMVSTDASFASQFSDSLATSVVRAKPYYPSYVSPSVKKDSPFVAADQPSCDWFSTSDVSAVDGFSSKDYLQGCLSSGHGTGWAGSWDGWGDWSQGKIVESNGGPSIKERNLLGSSFYDNDFKQESHASHEEASYTIDALGWNTPIVSSASLQRAPSSNLVKDSWNCQFPYDAYERHLKLHPAGPSETMSIKSPRTTIKPRVSCTSSLERKFGSSESLICGNGSAAVGVGNNHHSNPNKSLSNGSEDKLRFNQKQFSIHAERNDPIVIESLATKSDEWTANQSVIRDALDNIFKAEPAVYLPPLSPTFHLSVNVSETSNAVENSSESVDQYNTAVDSPCWKGAPVARVSPFEDSAVTTTKISPVFAEDTMEVSAQGLSEKTMHHSVEKDSIPSPMMFSVANTLHGETGDSFRLGFHPKIGCGYGTQSSFGIYVPMEGDSESVPFFSMPQNHGAKKLSSGKSNILASGGVESVLAGLSNGDSSEDGLYHVVFDATEQVLRSPSCAEDVPVQLTKTFCGESASKLDVQMLVNTLHDLSELLLRHCSIGCADLQEREIKFLEGVISNLDTCITKSFEQNTPTETEEDMFCQKGTSKYLGQSHVPNRSAGVDHSQMTEVPASGQDQLYEFASGKKDETAKEFVFTQHDANLMKVDNMTLALKKALCESFDDEEEQQPQTLLYKNLWLEAEAELCSTNLKARFNRVKKEMEKIESRKAKDVLENRGISSRYDVSLNPSKVDKMESETKGGPTQTRESSIHKSPVLSTTSHADDTMAKLHILNWMTHGSESINAANPGESSDLNISTDQDMVRKLAADKCEASLAGTFSPFSSSSHINDVMSRFQILKFRDDNSSSSIRLYNDENEVGKLVTEEKAASTMKNPVGSVNDPFYSVKSNPTSDLDASVMARFHILKSRGDDLQSNSTEGQPVPEAADHYCTGERNHQSGCSAEDKFTTKVVNTHLGYKYHDGWYDNSTSDWEHVMKEDLTGQNG